jgi:hypothetical protein
MDNLENLARRCVALGQTLDADALLQAADDLVVAAQRL